MSQINLQVKPEFEEELAKFMAARRIRTKSEAIRIAVREGLAAARRRRRVRFEDWVGLGNRSARSRKPRFRTDDDLWR
jgi:hypothetical protein